uniref:Uncharacterized protein n=1 Tax=Ciona intestinalis TaxID=7719 RepID=H2XZ47_CIOIN
NKGKQLIDNDTIKHTFFSIFFLFAVNFLLFSVKSTESLKQRMCLYQITACLELLIVPIVFVSELTSVSLQVNTCRSCT